MISVGVDCYCPECADNELQMPGGGHVQRQSLSLMGASLASRSANTLRSKKRRPSRM